MGKRPVQVYEFGPFKVDVREYVLHRGDEVVPLQPKTFDLLLLLVENRGRLLEKGEMMQALWPDNVVEESSLAHNISLLRKALGDDVTTPRYIETAPKRGYRFVAEVREVAADESGAVLQADATPPAAAGGRGVKGAGEGLEREPLPPTPAVASPLRAGSTRRKSWRLAALLCAALAAILIVFPARMRRGSDDGFTPRSLAVLPFITLGAGGDAELLGLGMADAIIIKLGKLRRPTTLPTGSVVHYSDRKVDALTIGRRLGVDAVLDGTVQRSGARIRVTVQLLDVRDGRAVWSNQFDERYSDVFAVQDAISAQLAGALTVRVDGSLDGELPPRPTQNQEAYQAYLMGLFFLKSMRGDKLDKAREYLEQAVALDPNFARARATLADCYFVTARRPYTINRGLFGKDVFARASSEADAALALDATLGEARLVHAAIAEATGDRIAAKEGYESALRLTPNYAVGHLRYGVFLFCNMQLDEALVELKKAQELDPLSVSTNATLASYLTVARRPDEAIRHARRTVELDRDYPPGHFILAAAYVQRRMFTEATAACDELKRTDPSMAGLMLAYIAAHAGRRREALDMITRLEAAAAKDGNLPYAIALVYEAMGERGKAFHWLERDSMAPHTVALLKFDPDLDALRRDPEFLSLLRRKGLLTLFGDGR